MSPYELNEMAHKHTNKMDADEKDAWHAIRDAIEEVSILKDKRIAELEKQLAERTSICAYCGGNKIPFTDPEFAQKMADHVLSCEKNPLIAMAKEACDLAESAEAKLQTAREFLGKVCEIKGYSICSLIHEIKTFLSQKD